jgi:branched-chain amino acid transport system ATP-binding protein
MLQVRDMRVGYGKTEVLHGISFDINKAECVALIGANGAGKTTALKSICALIPIWSGQIEFAGQRIDGLRGHVIVKKGITMCPEGRQIFPEMSVMENLAIGAYIRKDREKTTDINSMMELFPILKARAQQKAGTFSGGEQAILAIARALMSKPQLCIFDEPSVGLAPKMVAEVEHNIAKIKARGMTILLVEQNAAMALRLADRAYVFEAGEIVLHGTSEELKSDPKVKKAYLGQ